MPTPGDLADHLKEVLAAIDGRREPLIIDPRPHEDWWCGYPTFRTASGWEFVVFDDAGDWDYLEKATSPEGEVVEYPVKKYEDCTEAEKVLIAYGPEHIEDWGYPKYEPPKNPDGSPKVFDHQSAMAVLVDHFFQESPLLTLIKKSR